MAGTSGCIPDYHVNFFGQLCASASHSSRDTSPEPSPQVNSENQGQNSPVPSLTTDDAPAPDPIAEMFKEHQNLIRGLSCGNVETYLATIKDVFTAVRRSRKHARTEIPAEQRAVEQHKVEQVAKSQPECPDQNKIKNGDQHSSQQQAQPESEHKHQQKEQCQAEQSCLCQEHLATEKESQDQDSIQQQPQPQSQISPVDPSQSFIITHDPNTKGKFKPSREAIPPRSITPGRRYHSVHAIQ